MSENLATKLYSHTDEPAAEPAPSAPPGEEFARKLYNAPAPATGAELYPLENLIRSDLDQNFQKLAPRLRLSAEDQATSRAAYLAMLRRLGLDQDAGFAVRLHGKWTDAQLALERPGADPVVRDTEMRWLSEDAIARLKAKWGRDYDPVMARTSRLIESDAELNGLMGSGPGADFDTVNDFMEHVQRTGYR